MKLWIILDNSKKQFQMELLFTIAKYWLPHTLKKKIYIYIRPSMKQNVSGIDHKWIWKL